MTEFVKREGVIDLLIAQEQLACEFYRRCSRKFPERDDLWRPLIDAEETHARFLKEIAADPVDARGFGERRAFAVNPLRILVGGLRRQVEEFEGPGRTLPGALGLAREMENSILERKVLDTFPGDPPGVRERIQRLSAETSDHRALVEAALARLDA